MSAICKPQFMDGPWFNYSLHLGEFILRRNNEVGSENWGKAINCDPPQYFPDVKFYWARDYFPNFVEEDRRVMVSYDGYLYFSSLEKIDRVSVPDCK